MHLLGLGSMVERGDILRPQAQPFLQAIGRERKIMGGGLTEPETGGNWGLFVSRAIKDGDSYVLNGRKAFTSLAPVIDLFMVLVTVQDPDAGLLGGTFLVRGTPGLELSDLDAMGMRGTASHDLLITDVVPLSNVLRLRRIGDSSRRREPLCLVFFERRRHLHRHCHYRAQLRQHFLGVISRYRCRGQSNIFPAYSCCG
jgi:alkylation response protein AidB-like acyl-CoA dehydrogenase